MTSSGQHPTDHSEKESAAGDSPVNQETLQRQVIILAKALPILRRLRTLTLRKSIDILQYGT